MARRNRARRPLHLAVAGVTVLAVTVSVLGLVSAPSSGAGADVCPSGHVESGRFSDVDPSSVHAGAVDCVAWWGVATGRTASSFAGSADVTRGQLATFLSRMIGLAGRMPSGSADAFADDEGSVHEPALNALASLGIMLGVAPGQSAHGVPVTRGQSASLVARTLGWLGGGSLPGGSDAFSDDQGSPHEGAINSLASLGIVSGTTATTFRPNSELTRAQMASILVRSLSHLVEGGQLAVPTGPVATGVQPAVAGDAFEITWTGGGGNPHRWKILAFADDRYIGQRTFAGTARSGRILHLPPGTAVTFWIVPIDSNGAWSTWAVSDPVSLPADPACAPGPGACVHLDGGSTIGPATGTGLGFLHGATSATDRSRIDALEPRHWRMSALDADTFRIARDAGASITVIVSDPWGHYTASGDGRMLAPWVDWEAYESFVTEVARWHLGHGLLPDRWEIHNEPNAGNFVGEPITLDRLVETHVRAAAAIRSVLPGAEIVGPAVSPPSFGHHVSDIEGFTAKVAAAGLDLGAITWHEITGWCTTCDGGPSAVLQHIDDARAAMRAAGMGHLPIDINEVAADYEHLQPGAIVGYFSAAAHGGVRYANTTCWERTSEGGDRARSCYDGTLDGLLLDDRTTPTDAWWTHLGYAQISRSGARLIDTTVQSGEMSAVGSVSGSDRLQALVGRHVGCTPADGYCRSGTEAPSGDEPVTVRLTVPSSGTWTVVVSRIASTAGAAGPPAEVSRTTVPATSGPLNVGTFDLGSGEALQVEATRA